MPTATSEANDSPRPLPVWLSIPIILVCLGGGGWIIHWYVMTDPISHESKILGDVPPPPAGQFRGPPGSQGRIRRGPSVFYDPNGGNVRIRSEKARADLVVSNGKTTFRYAGYQSYAFLSADVMNTLAAADSLEKDQRRTEALKLDVHAVNKLRGLAQNPQMALSQADKDSLAALATQYVSNQKDRPAIEEKIIAQLDQYADRYQDATRQVGIEHAKQINAIITPEMWKQNAGLGNGGAPMNGAAPAK
jgi:hypothetical protein